MAGRGIHFGGSTSGNIGASSPPSQDNLSQPAIFEPKRERKLPIDGLITEFAGGGEENGHAMRELMECRKQIHDLKQELAAREEIHRNQRKAYNDLHSLDGEEICLRDKSIANLISERTSLEKQNNQQGLHIAQLQQEAESYRGHITELTETVLRCSTITSPSRDNRYFADEFARLHSSIWQWIMRYSDRHAVRALDYQDLSEALLQSLAKTVRTFTICDGKIQIHLKEIGAAISRMFVERIFDPSFVFVVSDWPSISPAEYPKVSDRETQKWRSQTVSMLVQHSGFEVRFANAVDSITKDLENCFVIYVAAGIEASRVKALRTLVENAARLQIEISRDLSKIQMPYICPGMPYDMQHMDDRLGIVYASEVDSDFEDDEEEQEENQDGEQKLEIQRKKEFIVDAVFFLPVLRFDFDKEGKFMKTPIIIRKGVVDAFLA